MKSHAELIRDRKVGIINDMQWGYLDALVRSIVLGPFSCIT